MPLSLQMQRWKMAKFFPLENTCYLSGWFLLHVLLLHSLCDLLPLPHNLRGSCWCNFTKHSLNIILPWYVARSAGFASALCWVPQKMSLALELRPEAQGGEGTTRMLIFVLRIPTYSTPAGRRRRRELPQRREEQSHCSLHLGPWIFLHLVCCWGLHSKCWSLLTHSVFLGELFTVLVSVLAGDYAGRENKQLCHPSVHTNTLPGADCTVGKMTPKLCVMSRKRLETALAMLKIDISGRGKKKREKKTPPLSSSA